MFTIIIIIITIMQNHNFINFILHRVYCNLVEYCNIVYYGTLCELYYNLCECQEQQINLVHKLEVPRVTLHYLWTHGAHSS